ncbi:MAG: sensor histidine kinase [Oscillospiraceae bacterium]|nr:sensor histidine kinase [Oscillospiraceae bacterium]
MCSLYPIRGFDCFYTSSANANPQGTGQGLFIANQTAQRHNADIRMEKLTESTVVFWKYAPENGMTK